MMNIKRATFFLLFFLPSFCLADMGMPSIFENSLISLIFGFIFICFIESKIIEKILQGNYSLAVKSSFCANLVTLIIGLFFNIAFIPLFPSPWWLLACLIITIIVEYFVLLYFYREASIINLITTSLIINLVSYFMLLLWMIGGAIMEFVLFSLPIYYLILLVYKKIFKKGPNTVLKIVIFIISYFLFNYLFFYTLELLREKEIFYNPSNRHIQMVSSKMDEFQSAAVVYKLYHGSYGNVSINQRNYNCRPIQGTLMEENSENFKMCEAIQSLMPYNFILYSNNESFCLQKTVYKDLLRETNRCVDGSGFIGEGKCNNIKCQSN